MAEVGQIVSSKYKLLRLLGDGGMGSVYEAEHLRLGTHVAIKVLHSELARRSGLVERFLQEARVSAQIRSPHVCHVTDVESTPDGIAYLVMELLQGEPLSNVERRERTLSVGTACEYTIQILRALEAAHSLGVIHRDLKPDNVFVTFEGGRPVLKLIDFGIAKLKHDTPGVEKKNLTVAGMLMGTPEYMAPEQAYSADKVDVRADLYAVGVMLYEMLAGTTPATGADPRVVVAKVERGDITPLITAAPNVPREIAGLVHRAMAPRPEMRFASATEMRLAIEGAVTGKKPPTGLLPAMGGSIAPQQGSVAPFQGSVAPFQGSVAPFQGSVAPAPAGSAPEVGTGTVMGAPAEGALVAPAVPGSGPPPPMQGMNARPGTGTVGAAPLQTRDLHGPNPHVMTPPVAMTPSYQPPTAHGGHGQRKSGGAGLIVALAIVALLLGAGAVVTYVMSTTPATPPPVDPFATSTVQTLTTPATTTPPPPTTPTSTQPVVPLQPGPQPQPQPQPQPKTDAGTAPKTDAGASPSNTVIPPFPPFPSGFPSTFPSAIPPFPSGFPSAIPFPSGFPPLFPPTPPPQK